jgi:hypothetical protein
MSTFSTSRLLFVASLISYPLACSSGNPPSKQNDGGASDGVTDGPGTGGFPGSGGASVLADARTPGTGGVTATGGLAGTGGVSATGGVTASGGRPGTGGITATGGATRSGGASGTGGDKATGGATASGGRPGTGGITATGGATRSGGASGTGGVSATGGVTASGGRPGTGGITATGGTTGSSGASGSGGDSATGGATGSGGASGTGGIAGVGGSTASGGSTGTGGEYGFTYRSPGSQSITCTDSGQTRTFEVLDEDWLCTFHHDSRVDYVYVRASPTGECARFLIPLYQIELAQISVDGVVTSLADAHYDFGGNHHNDSVSFAFGGKTYKYSHSSLGYGYRQCQPMDCMVVYAAGSATTVETDGCTATRTLPEVCVAIKADQTHAALAPDPFKKCPGDPNP